MSDRSPGTDPSNNDRRSRQRPLVMLTSGLAIYLAVLWFGIKVIGDTIPRSSLMAGLIVILAGMGYVSTRRAAARDES